MAMKVAETEITLLVPQNDGNNNDFYYIDCAQLLSKINRRLYRQGKVYYLSNAQLISGDPSGVSNLTIEAIPDTWVTRNAWYKSFKVWQQMQSKVLEDNPSIVGTWDDFKVFMEGKHEQGGYNGYGPYLNLGGNIPGQANANTWRGATETEWNMSTLVLPEHNVNPATGEVLTADQFHLVMMGGDSSNPIGNGGFGGIIKAYQDTRARIQDSPDTPNELSESWITLLMDTGSQEPELANVIEGQNDFPPYARLEYVGGASQFSEPNQVGILYTSTAQLKDNTGPICAPLGLLRITVPSNQRHPVNLKLSFAPGNYNGVMAENMKQ